MPFSLRSPLDGKLHKSEFKMARPASENFGDPEAPRHQRVASVRRACSMVVIGMNS